MQPAVMLAGRAQVAGRIDSHFSEDAFAATVTAQTRLSACDIYLAGMGGMDFMAALMRAKKGDA